MSQWAELKELAEENSQCQKDIVDYYSTIKFPIDIRHDLARWIESANWMSFCCSDPDGIDVMKSLKQQCGSPTLQQNQSLRDLEDRYPTNQELCSVVMGLLEWEKGYISSYEKMFPNIQDMEKILETCHRKLTTTSQMGAPSEHFEDLLSIWKNLQSALEMWRRHQQLVFITEEEVVSLDSLQPSFDLLATVLAHYAKQPETQKRAKELLEEVVKESFIIERQHPQNLKHISSSKKGIKFSLLVRFLAGSVLKANSRPAVTVTFHCEKNLSDLQSRQKHTHGNVLVNDKGNEAYLECEDSEEGRWCTDLTENLKIIAFRKCDEKKSTEEVSERKYGFRVETTVEVEVLRAKKIKLEAVTLPVIITTQTSQDCNATATLLWDSAFAEPGRQCYYVPDRVPWPKLASVLSRRFKATTGRGLDAQQKQCLAKKLCGNKKTDYQRNGNGTVTWAAFNKTKMCKDFTFWRWFYAVNNLVKKHLKKPWQDGLIHGFIDKAEVKEKLREEGLKSGTFILRFSEKNIEDNQSTHFGGGLCVAYMEKSEGGHTEIEFVYPFMASEFEQTPFCKYLMTLEVEDEEYSPKKSPLNFLYPNKPFLQAFADCIQEEKAKLPASDEPGLLEDYKLPIKKLTIQSRQRSAMSSPAHSHLSYAEDQQMDVSTEVQLYPPFSEVITSPVVTTDTLLDILTTASSMPSTLTLSTSSGEMFGSGMTVQSEDMGQGSSGESLLTHLTSILNEQDLDVGLNEEVSSGETRPMKH